MGTYREPEGYTFGTGKKNKRPVSVIPQPQQQLKDTSRFHVGTLVRHARFGTGEVISMRGEGRNLFITVRFAAAGNKELAAAFAPLEVLEEN